MEDQEIVALYWAREEKALAATDEKYGRPLHHTALRMVFLRRYWYGDTILEIGARYDFSQSKVKSMLARTRKKLKEFLQGEGIFL